MLQVARLAPRLLGDSCAKVEAFLQDQFNADGGACDRDGESDLYYTVFALDGLCALQAELPTEKVIGFLDRHGKGRDLDLVHLACLARCWAAMPNGPNATVVEGIVTGLESFRTEDGGYGSIYHCFLALGAYGDLGRDRHEVNALLRSMDAYRSEDGGYGSSASLAVGSTPVTAAAVTLLQHLDRELPPEAGRWLLSQAQPEGGFVAAPELPMPDLLSTAVALHALSAMAVDFSSIKEPCLDFIDSLWSGKAFCGTWADDMEDSEYTFYALLALGHLSL